MPRLSLYRPEKTKDFKFFDRTIYEMFQVGGVDVYVHKYIGPVDPMDPSKALGPTAIQDVLFLENRDRKYDVDVYTIRGHYQTQDVDFNLSQFGLFLQNDTVFMTVHINNSVDLIGRKIMIGDVFEIPNLREEYFFDSLSIATQAIRKYYVVEEINRAAEGFSATWYPHLYRIKLKPIVDSQEFADIFNQPENKDTYAGTYSPDVVYYPGQTVTYQGTLYVVKDSVGPNGTSVSPPDTVYWDLSNENSLRDVLSTYNKALELNNAVVLEAELDAPKSGFETKQFYTLAVNPDTGATQVNSADSTIENIADANEYVSDITDVPLREGYSGYLLGDGQTPNGVDVASPQFGFGIQFPQGPTPGDTFLRTDYFPNRLFRYDGVRWIKQEDNVRMTLSNTDSRQTLKTSFINNNEVTGIDQLGSDIVVISADNNNTFDDGNITTAFVVEPTNVYIETSIDYNAKYRLEVWLNEDGHPADVTIININNKFAFRINEALLDKTMIRYTIYKTYVEQRQSLSKALRKLTPEADL